MPTKLEHRDVYAVSTARLHAALCSEQYWTDLVRTVAPDVSSLESFTSDGSSVTVKLLQIVPADKLPSIVTKIRSGDLTIRRTFSIGPFSDRSTGSFGAEVDGAKATLSGSVTVSGSDGQATLTYSGAAKVGIPLVGGKIESAIVSNLTKLFDAEAEFTADWLAANPG